jgi:TRAP-type mannitol/chloroaromatic compound transport system permease large subunit
LAYWDNGFHIMSANRPLHAVADFKGQKMQVPIESMALKLFTGIEKFEIMAIPFFILTGNFLTHGGVARRMIRFATAMVGHWHGGLGLAGVIACALFAAVSGSSPTCVVAIGSVILPAMLKQGFPKEFGAGVITTSGALGILIWGGPLRWASPPDGSHARTTARAWPRPRRGSVPGPSRTGCGA